MGVRVIRSALVAKCLIGLASLAFPLIAHAKLQPPTNLAATTLSASRIHLSWTDNSKNERGFLIERAPDSGGAPGTWAQIATVGANVTTFSDRGLSANRTYWFRVRAQRNGNGAKSVYSNRASATTLPRPPSNLTAAAASANRIDLSWTGDPNGESGFLIERAPDSGGAPGAWVQIATVGADVTAYSDMGLTPNTTYWYRVRAYNSAGNSDFTKVVGARTPSIACTLSVVGWGYNGDGEATPPADLTNVVAIAAGYYHSLALKSDGTVVGWGYDGDGEATPPADLTNAVAIAAGDSYSLALKSDRTVVGWGYDGDGEATPPADLTNAVAIAAGYYHSLALTSDGTVVGWGSNYYGETTPPDGLTGVVAIAAGAYHSLALKSDGTVVGWGYNSDGEATSPPDLTNALAIAAGAYHSLALKSDGTVVGWGYNYYGQATPPADLSNVVAIAAGGYHGLALKSDGTIVSWGDDGNGQLSGADGLSRVSAIAAGGFHNLALTMAAAGPSALTATIVATNQVNLSWMDNSTTEDGFKIERALDDGFYNPGTWTQIATVSANITNYSDTTVETNTTYWYRVRAASSACGDSLYTSRAVVSLVPPAAPYSLSAVGVATNQVEVDLYWYAGSGNEAGYRIERAPDDNGNPGTWAEIATVVGGTNTFYIDAGVSPNTPYWYCVRAYNLFGDSPYTDPTEASVEPPGAPYLYASVVTTNQAEVDLQWYDSSGIAAGYKIERAPDVNGSPGTWTEITNTVNNFYSDTGLMANATYWYRVRAYNLIGDSDYSDPISVNFLPPAYAPYPYAYLIATNQVEVRLDWYDYYNNYLTVAGYKIERAPDVSGNPGVWTEIATVASGYSYPNSYTDTGVAATNATYWYRVRAYNVVGESPYSYPTSVSIGPPAYAPSYINASADLTNVEVDVYWYDYNNYSGSVAGYKIERAPDVSGSPGTWTKIATVASGFSYYSFYPDTGVVANATYWYRVRAYNVVGDSPYSSAISISVVPPAAPYFIYAYTVPTSLEADMYWYESDSVAGYKIERAPDVNGNPGSWTQIATNVGGSNNFYQDTTVEPNKTYWYRVRAYNGIGDSAPSAAVSVSLVPPAGPSTLTATIAATNQVKLSWSESDSNVAGYKVERAPDNSGSPGTWQQIATLNDYSTQSYYDTTVTLSATYWYRVRAYNAVGDSPYSNEASVTIAPPAAPSNLSATPVSSSRIDLTWTDNSNNESSFKIERSTDGTNFTQIAQVLANTASYRNTGLLPNSTYYYRVRASNPVADSDFSNVASANTLAQCPVSVVGWGNNGDGQTTPPTNLIGVAAITAGSYHSLALKTNGTVVGWGNNGDGQTTPPTNLIGVAAITAGSYHSLALKSDGTVVGWGYDGYGEATTPAGLTGVVAVAAGYYHSLGLKSDGTIVGWGYYYYATPPADLAGVVAIAAGVYHSLALKSDGTVVGWGYNGYGETTPPAGLSNVVAIAAGGYHSLALTSDGTVIGWGYNYYGETTPPAGLSNVVAIAAGGYHSLALKSDGTAVGWGYNYDGEATTPAGLSGVVAITAGGYHSLALSTDLGSPSAFTATAISASEVGLSWTYTASNEDGFKIERAPDNGGSPGTWTQIVAVAANITTYTDAGLTTNTTYWYRGQAYNVCTNSPYSTPTSVVTAPPRAPLNLTAMVADTNQVNLSWMNNYPDVGGFKIERALDNGGSPGTWAQVATVGGDISTYTDTGLVPNTTYWYRIRAYNAVGDSSPSNPASATLSGGQLITVMQWNIEGHLGNILSNNTAEAKTIARIINYNRPDVLLFCELQDHGVDGDTAGLTDWVTNNLPYLGSQPGATFYVGIATAGDGFERNGAISRFPIANETTYSDGLRGLHAFQVQINRTPALQVYHAHLKCCSDGDSCDRKQSEAQSDAAIISGVAATSPLPYIFGGDWNEDESNPECALTDSYHPITTIRQVGGLVEFKPTTLDGEYRTWSTATATPSIRFDYILAATNRLAPVSGYVFSSMVWANHGLYAGNYNDSQVASDHYCVFAKYFFPAPDFTVTPTNAFASTGYVGGPFSPVQQVYTLTNTNSIPLPWGVTANASWLSVSATNGTLAAGASTNITVSIGSAANSLGGGQYAVTIGFNNTATHAFTTRDAGLTVLWPPPVVAFSGSPTVGVVPLAVAFIDMSTGNITTRFWDFGDGSTTSTTTNSLVHTYSVGGTYPVTLVATGPGGVSTNGRPGYVTALTPYQVWQIQYFGSTNNPAGAPDADPDGDGMSNLQEFIARTDPTDAASVFAITAIQYQRSNSVVVSWTAMGGTTNLVQGGTGDDFDSYFPTNVFYDISPLIIIPGSGLVTTNFVDGGQWLDIYIDWPVRYYRIKLVP